MKKDLKKINDETEKKEQYLQESKEAEESGHSVHCQRRSRNLRK